MCRRLIAIRLAVVLVLVPAAAPASAEMAGRQGRLAEGVVSIYSRAPLDVVWRNVWAATAAEDASVPAELLLALARTESSYDPTWVSRIVNGSRQIGRWRSDKQPPGSSGNFYCGVTQATGRTWKQCFKLRDLDLSYRTTVKELGYWLDRCRYRAKLWECALAGYGGGNDSAARGTSSYARRVLRRARALGAQI